MNFTLENVRDVSLLIMKILCNLNRELVVGFSKTGTQTEE